MDRALTTARRILYGLVCECGHTDSEHIMARRPKPKPCSECLCDNFTAVFFLIERIPVFTPKPKRRARRGPAGTGARLTAEDKADLAAVRRALNNPKRIPLEEVRRSLGLKKR
jgi:hypothetical protein